MSEKDEYQIREELTQCYLEMSRCLVEKDTTNLAIILDDSFVLVHMTGMRQSKKEYLSYIDEGLLCYYSSKMEHIDIKIQQDSAKLICQSRVDAAVFGGGRHTWPLQLAIEIRKKDGKWLMTKAVASTY